MVNNEPKIAVIIPTHNRPKLLVRAVCSVFNQTQHPDELIIIDDGSHDLENHDVKTTLHDSPIPVRAIQQPHLGVSAARNHGVSLSSGDWVAFLDSDDEWFPNKLKIQSKIISRDQSAVCVHSDEVWFKNDVHMNQKNTTKNLEATYLI